MIFFFNWEISACRQHLTPAWRGLLLLHAGYKLKCYLTNCWTRGGTHIGKWYGDVARSWPPFFRPVATPQPTNLPSMRRSCAPCFQFLENFCIFNHVFAQNFSSLDPNFSKFSFPRPPFFKENPLPRPYILKAAWHTPTKKSWVPPRAVESILGLFVFILMHCLCWNQTWQWKFSFNFFEKKNVKFPCVVCIWTHALMRIGILNFFFLKIETHQHERGELLLFFPSNYHKLPRELLN